ncbi:hypothetical protein MSG28_008403 [Choristoneura fumiferana]|uniref:Uncharacterized protein n=1 Tax=Choristoneura fumiferana TaxID=7141 RepID=A0ACC0J522_CHOFU|nr:hypothetical protein MSG28_008403 [Choristoneura fumiferana]
MISAKWLVLWSLWAARLARQPTAPLRVSGGRVRGSVAHDGSHAAYLGIPYATLTHGNRFQAPGPEPKWEGIFDGVEENARCLQRLDIRGNIFIGQQDCLTLNVYTPLNASPDAHLPVMVFIHGGAFVEGSGSPGLYGPKYITSKGVILITINYRLNAQGFLCLRVKEAPGNAGIKDQVAALRWIQKNIRVFGGDPGRVTLFGESAGASSVSHHLLSHMSKGLFHRAIMQSGSALAPWGHQVGPVKVAASLAKVKGHTIEDPHELYKLFTSMSELEILTPRIPRELGGTIMSEMLVSPCVEKVIDGVEPFLTEDPYTLLAKGEFTKMPIMIGTNDEEGYFLASYENTTTLSKMNFERAMPVNLEFPTERERSKEACRIKEMYMGNDTISKESLVKLSKFHGEPFFVYPAVAETELVLKNSDQPVYNYVFKYDGRKNIAKWYAGFSGLPGAAHGDELFYLFEQHNVPNMFEWRMMDTITTLWTNFAKYGDPTPETTELLPVKWYPTNRTSPQAFVIDRDFSTTPLWSDSLKYWHEIYTKYRKKHRNDG